MKEQPDVPKALAEIFKRLGGVAEMTKWARTHKTLFYSHYVKMLPTQIAAQVDVRATVVTEEEAKQKLYDAFMRLIEARDLEMGTVIVNDEVVYRDPRITDQSIDNQSSGNGRPTIDGGRTASGTDRATIDAPSSIRGVDEPSRVNQAQARDGGHGTADKEQVPRADGSTHQNKNHSNLEHDGSPLVRGPSADRKASAQSYPRPVSNAPRELNTTEKFLEWNGGGRTWWGPV